MNICSYITDSEKPTLASCKLTNHSIGSVIKLKLGTEDNNPG